MTTVHPVAATRKQPPAPLPSRPHDSHTCVSAVLIARRAYQIWDQDGRPEVAIDQFWSRAEAELRNLTQ